MERLAAAPFRFVLAVLLAVPLALGTGCSLGRTTSTSSTSEDGHSRGTSISLHGNPDEANLERARAAARDGQVDEADAILSRLADSPATDAEVRETARLELGELWSSVLNPRRDPERAATHFRRFLEDFPDSERAREAEAALERLTPAP